MNEITNDALRAQADLSEIGWILERVTEALMKHEHEWADAGIPEMTREVLADRLLDANQTIDALGKVLRYAIDEIAREAAR